MECPRCNKEVSENDKVCPHCKKVLLLECPVCHKLSRTPLCSECGFLILSKCHKCGQINQTVKGVCKKCGFDTYKSISLNEAETEEFACLTISFPNLDELRPALKNKQIFSKFNKKLKSLIFNFALEQENRAQLIDGTYVIKYYKEFSFSSSVNKALKSALELMNKIAGISYKFQKSKKIKMACKMAILKRTLDNDNESFNTGLNIKLIDTDSNKSDYNYGLQLITDQYINSIISRQYKLEMIYSSQVNDELLEFYEFPLKEHLIPVIVEDEPEEKTNILTKPKELPKINLESDESRIDLYTDKVIDIKTKCEFISVQGIDVPEKIKTLLKSPRFITIKASEHLQLSSNSIKAAINSVNSKILHVACNDAFVYEPYAFFKELIASYLLIDTKLANLDASSKRKLDTFDSEGVIYNLLTHSMIEGKSPQELLGIYLNVFFNFVKLQRGSVIFIENLDLIDETSLEILISLISDFSELGVSFVVTVPDNYSVHKEINELLYLDVYSEITVAKTDVNRLVETITEDISEIKDSFYFTRIKEQCMGGTLYFEHAFQYLKDVNILVSHDGKLYINSEKTVIFPSSLEQLIAKRFESMDENACFVLAYSCFLGSNMIIGLLNDLEIDKLDEAIRTLIDKKLVSCQDFIITVPNYRLVQKCIKGFLAEDVIQLINKRIYEKLKTKTLSVIRALGLISDSRMNFYELAKYAINHGDFNVYLRNCKRFLSILDEIPKNEISQEMKDAKKDIFTRLAQYLNKYPSHKIYAISKIIFDKCVRKKDDLMIMNTSSLMLDSAMMGSNYILAQQSLHNVLIRMLNPALVNENDNVLSKYFFYSCINVKILFQTGKFKQCIETLDKIILSINQELFVQFGRSNVSKDSFVNYFMSICVLGALARVFVCDNTLIEFFKKIEYMFGQRVPGQNTILLFEKLIHNEEFEIDSNIIEIDDTANVVLTLIKAVKSFDGDYNIFAQNVYNAKLIARTIKEPFWNLLCDLIIGYCYQKCQAYVKANVIYQDVLSIAQKSGMSYIQAIANYLIENLKYDNKEYDTVLKMINDNAVVLSNLGDNNLLIMVLSLILQINVIISSDISNIDIEPILYKIRYACENNNLSYLQSFIQDYNEYIEKYKASLESNNFMDKNDEIADNQIIEQDNS